MNSFNHYSLGSVGEWLYRYVAGIDVDPDLPGYERIVIRPHPGVGLTRVRATYDSIRGRIESAWQIDGDALIVQATIPANTTATVYLPTSNVATITEKGVPVREAEGVGTVRVEAGQAVVIVGSGTYTFHCAAPQ